MLPNTYPCIFPEDLVSHISYLLLPITLVHIFEIPKRPVWKLDANSTVCVPLGSSESRPPCILLTLQSLAKSIPTSTRAMSNFNPFSVTAGPINFGQLWLLCIAKAFIAKDVVGFSSVSGILSGLFQALPLLSWYIFSSHLLRLHSDRLVIVQKMVSFYWTCWWLMRFLPTQKDFQLFVNAVKRSWEKKFKNPPLFGGGVPVSSEEAETFPRK